MLTYFCTKIEFLRLYVVNEVIKEKVRSAKEKHIHPAHAQTILWLLGSPIYELALCQVW